MTRIYVDGGPITVVATRYTNLQQWGAPIIRKVSKNKSLKSKYVTPHGFVQIYSSLGVILLTFCFGQLIMKILFFVPVLAVLTWK